MNCIEEGGEVGSRLRKGKYYMNIWCYGGIFKNCKIV